MIQWYLFPLLKISKRKDNNMYLKIKINTLSDLDQIINKIEEIKKNHPYIDLNIEVVWKDTTPL